MGAQHVHVWVDALGATVLAAVVIAAAFDLVLEGRKSSIGLVLARWSARYPLFAAGLIFLFGAMLGHFFTQG
jgi:hypothetical protein